MKGRLMWQLKANHTGTAAVLTLLAPCVVVYCCCIIIKKKKKQSSSSEEATICVFIFTLLFVLLPDWIISQHAFVPVSPLNKLGNWMIKVNKNKTKNTRDSISTGYTQHNDFQIWCCHLFSFHCECDMSVRMGKTESVNVPLLSLKGL